MQNVNLFGNSNNAQLVNSNLNIVVTQHMDPSAVLRFLYEAVAKYAGSGHQDPSTCLEGTRTTALQDIDEWKRKNKEEQGSELMWLTGSAGSGKTAIAQTVCDKFRADGLLVVDCSFFRSTNCTNPKYLFLTIAYQLAVGDAQLKASIEAAVQADPAVVNAPLDALLKRLILGPITEAGSQLPTIFIVLDGLDECGVENDQIQIIHLIQSILTDQHLPLRFLIASRPEIWIRNAFFSPAAHPLSTVTLNQDSEADDDIRFFYQTEFTKIRQHPEHTQSLSSAATPWPSGTQLHKLVSDASGQFIYAKTVTRFVGEPGYSPARRLEVVLWPHSKSTKSGSPLDRLDALYSYMLSCTADWDITSSVLGALAIFMDNPFPGSADLYYREALSIIEVILSLNPGEACLSLRSLHAVLFVPPDLTAERETKTDKEYRAILDNKSQHPQFYHTSFTDFLHNRQHAGKYFIGEEKNHQEMAIGCLKVLLSVNLSPPTRIFSLAWHYAFCCWDLHSVASGSNGNQKLLNELDCFSFTSWCFLAWKAVGDPNWETLAPFRQFEKWNDDSLEAIQKVRGTLEPLDWVILCGINASDLWNWMTSQSDISLRAFPMLRLKLWILHKLAGERGFF